MDEIINKYVTELEQIYVYRTAGDHTFDRVLRSFLYEINGNQEDPGIPFAGDTKIY